MTTDLRDPSASRDHGGRIDAAVARYGGERGDWIDLSTGINPVPYPIGDLPCSAWTDLPDQAANTALIDAARAFWPCPERAAVLAVPGLSLAISLIPRLTAAGRVSIATPTYNEHAAAFRAAGWDVTQSGAVDARVAVHPNNPDGRIWRAEETCAPLSVIDESFCDTAPEHSLIHLADRPGTLVLKSFGKFWGLAGLRLGFVIGDPDLVAMLAAMLGPWVVSGPALHIGAAALRDPDWADDTRARLAHDRDRLDNLLLGGGAILTGGTSLFRLYNHSHAQALHDHLAQHHIWTRLFPWSDTAIRFGLPGPNGWSRLQAALDSAP
tara:strand:- start:18197 stop:19168 length:972 start_codon:yes stop_codon:yes gene_type:complete